MGSEGIVVRFLAGKGIFLFLPSVYEGSGASLASCAVGTGGSSQELKRLGRETEHLPQCSAEVENDGSCTFTPSIFHCGMQSSLFNNTRNFDSGI